MTVDAIIDLIRSEFIPRGEFTAAEIYEHESEPMDLDMYEALRILVESGLIEATNPGAVFHDEMRYTTSQL